MVGYWVSLTLVSSIFVVFTMCSMASLAFFTLVGGPRITNVVPSSVLSVSIWTSNVAFVFFILIPFFPDHYCSLLVGGLHCVCYMGIAWSGLVVLLCVRDCCCCWLLLSSGFYFCVVAVGLICCVGSYGDHHFILTVVHSPLSGFFAVCCFCRFVVLEDFSGH